MIISKELVCEVLDIDERLCRLDKLIDNTLFFYTLNNTGEYQHYINIYEFAHKCKEWAFQEHKVDFEIIRMKDVKNYGKVFVRIHTIHTNSINGEEFYPFSIEPEGVIKACQWLFDNKRIAK